MMSTFLSGPCQKAVRRLAGLWLLVPLLAQEPSQPTPASPPVSASDLKAAIGNTTKPASATPAKLEAPIEAVARAWRRHGIKGAERESAAQAIQLDRLRVAGVIHVKAEERRAEVVKALRRAWGEVLAVQENRVYAWIPVPALRRISSMDAVNFIYLDRPLHPAGEPSKEKLR